MDGAQLTPDRLKNVLNYDPETGEFTWKQRCGKRGVPGKVAGTIDFSGYRVITIGGKRHKAHRLAWLWVRGAWPAAAIDHINGRRDDNRMANLREATAQQNQHNRGRQTNNRSGLMGVSWDSRAGKWRAGIHAQGKSRNLGNYGTAQEAHEAYLVAKAALHPFQPAPRNA